MKFIDLVKCPNCGSLVDIKVTNCQFIDNKWVTFCALYPKVNIGSTFDYGRPAGLVCGQQGAEV